MDFSYGGEALQMSKNQKYTFDNSNSSIVCFMHYMCVTDVII